MGAEPEIHEQDITRANPPGSRLRAGREAAGLTVEQVGAELRLAPEVIEALERDDYGSLPPPIFVRGYVRRYAGELGLPADELVDAYTSVVGGDQSPPLTRTGKMHTEVRSGDARMRWATYGIIALLIILVAVWLYNREFRGASAPESAAPPAEATAPTAAPEATAPATSPSVQPPAGSAAEGGTATTGEAPAPTAAPSQAEQPSASPAPESAPAPVPSQPEAAPPAPAAEAAGHSLGLTFTGTCWVEVRDATGKRLLMRLAKAGEKLSVDGQPPFHVLLGNAPAVRVSLDGKPFDASPFVRGRVARFEVQ